MSGNRFINTGGGDYSEINTGGGSYNESIQGDSINIQGNYININQDLSQSVNQINQRLIQLQNQGYSSQAAQYQVANDLAVPAKNNAEAKAKLAKLGKYVSDAAANGLIGEAVGVAVKVALGLAGIPLLAIKHIVET